MKAVAALVLGIAGCFGTAAGQCPATDFSLPPAACLDQRVTAANLSDPGTYAWDFCAGDFMQTPSAQLIGSLTGVNGRPGIEFAFDTKWHAFVTGTFSNVLYRLDFDGGLQDAPTAVVNLGSLSGALNQPGQIRILSEGGQWFGLLHNTGGDLLKLSFGSQLSNTPTVSSLISGVGYINSGLAVGKDPVNGYVCVLSNAANQFTIVRLGLSLAAPNPASDVITSGAVPNPNNLGDIDLIPVCGNWYGFAVNLGNGNIYRLDFGSSLFSPPVITQVQTLTAANPGRLRLALEGDRYYFLALALDGTLAKGDFGASITATPAVTNEGNLGGTLTASMYGIALVKENSAWTVLGVNQASGQYFRINYTDNCSAIPKTSTTVQPIVSYANSGTYLVSLMNTSGFSTGTKTKSIVVSAAVAPDIDFSTLNNCAQHTVQFTSVNASGNLVAYDWDFGDGNSSSAPNPGHIYALAGTFLPRLTVTASNGCSNEASAMLSVFSVPSADFAVPGTSPVCTNQAYDFTNASSYDPGSNPSWEWRVNGSLVSTQTNLATTFVNPVAHEIRLKASIPGCENEMIKNIPAVMAGPLVDFSAADDCALNSVSFSNATTGADTGYAWNFGDGSPPSAQAMPDHTYTNPGTYPVTLTASNAAGCNNFITKDIVIYSVPQPTFSVGLPPFSCSNAPTLFQNNTPALTDSNITDWLWTFGDPASSTSADRDPSFTYTAGGNYSVSLTATSDAGCTKEFTSLVTIGTSPVADFAQAPACVNQSTQFTDLSSGGIQSRAWQIGGSLFTTANPSYTFTAPGNYSVTLTVTSTGGCNSIITKPVDVPFLPVLMLQVENPCADQPATFTLVEGGLPPAADPAIGWQWNIGGSATSGNPVTQAVSLAGPTPVSVMSTHASGCVYTTANAITIHPSPVADFIATPDRGDAPLTVQFQNTSSGATQYQWLFSGTPPGISTETSPVFTFLELGDYTAMLTATNANGCEDTKSAAIQVLVPVIDLEVIAFTLSPDGVTGKLRPSLTVRNGSNVPVSALDVVIHLSDKATVSEVINGDLLPGESLTFALALTLDPAQFSDGFVCAEVASEKETDPADNRQCISWEDSSFIFSPYPNPSNGALQVDWVSRVGEAARITVYNAQGRTEYAWETSGAAGLNQSMHDLSFLAAGIYFVSVQTSTSLETFRFVRL